MSKSSRPRNAYCSFCRKSYLDVGPFVEGPAEVYICGECVELSASIIDQENHRRRRIEGAAPFTPTRESVRTCLDGLFPGQNEAKEGLILAAFATLQPHRPLLLIGPSRGARIFVARALARALEVPFARVDATEIVSSERPPNGSLLQQIVSAADYDVDRAGRSVVYADRIEDPARRKVFCNGGMTWRTTRTVNS
jgi:ATP-dependent Clp protease ATP-binding subunit ClpX